MSMIGKSLTHYSIPPQIGKGGMRIIRGNSRFRTALSIVWLKSGGRYVPGQGNYDWFRR